MRGLWIASCMFLLVMTGSAFAQLQTYDFLGGGARAEGMGNAFIGVSNDVSAASWNPAGLATHEGPMLGLAWGTFRPRGQAIFSGDDGPLEYGYTGSFSNLTFASFLAPVRIRGQEFVLAGAYTQTAEDFWGNNFDMFFSDVPHEFYLDSTYDMSVSYDDSYHASPMMINLAFATLISQSIDAGLAVNIYGGKATYRQEFAFLSYGYLAPDKGQELLKDSTVSQLDTSSYSGVNFTFGMRYKAPKWTAGLMLKSGFALEDLRDQKFGDTIRYNGLVRDGRSLFFDDLLIKYNIPWIFGAGLSYNLKENWLLAMDAEYRPYSGKTYEVRTVVRFGAGGEKEEVFAEYDPGWFNVFTVRTGTEYLWSTGLKALPIVPVRAGFAYVPLPTPDVSYSVSDTSLTELGREKVTMYRLSAGTGIHWSQIHLDVSYTYSSADRSVNTVPIELNNRFHRLNFMFTGYF